MKFEKLVEYANCCKKFNKPMQLLVEMPGFHSPEMIVNPPENIEGKLAYYAETYDENCKHKHAEGIAIIDVVHEMDISEVSTAFLPFPQLSLQPGHVRFTSNAYVGEHSKDIAIEGAADDVIKVLGVVQKSSNDEQ